MSLADPPLLALLIDGPGSHPAAWRASADRDADALSADHYEAAVLAAESAGFALVVIDDGYAPRHPGGLDSRRLDAVTLAARIAPRTRSIGLAPVVSVTYTEPYLVSKAIATLDFIAEGRGAWAPRLSPTAPEALAAGRQAPPDAAELSEWAAEHIEVTVQLWDSWEDDAVIRDTEAGRFIDGSKLHRLDFDGRRLRVQGPSTTPRPPQGHPPTVILDDGATANGAAGTGASSALAARFADVIVTGSREAAAARQANRDARSRSAEHGRRPLVFSTVTPYLDGAAASGRQRRDALQALAPWEGGGIGYVLTAAPDRILDELSHWAQDTESDGVLVAPPLVRETLDLWPRGLAGRSGGADPGGRSGRTLRSALGLPRAANLLAATS